MKVVIEENLAECKKLWETFSPHRTLFDEWDVAFCFFDKTIHSLYFLVLVDNNKPKGLLPLMYESSTKSYMSFGGEYMEDIHFWFDKGHFQLMFDNLPLNTYIFDINHIEFESLSEKFPALKSHLTETDYHYFLNLNDFSHDLQKYISSFGKKHRKNLFYDLRKFESRGAGISWSSKNLGFNKLVKYNVERFGKESDFIDPDFTACMKKLLSSLKKKNILYTSLLTKGKKIIGVEYAAFHKQTYYVLNGGYDLSHMNAGKYLIMLHLKKAEELKADYVDFLSGDSGWKKLWNLQSTPYYTIHKKKES